MEKLVYIKHLVLHDQIRFTNKAVAEMTVGNLDKVDIIESIVNASFFRSKRSRSEQREFPGEKVYIIEGFTFSGVLVYTKGVIRKTQGLDLFYVLISAKRSERGNR